MDADEEARWIEEEAAEVEEQEAHKRARVEVDYPPPLEF
jgi:hypothetical protein